MERVNGSTQKQTGMRRAERAAVTRARIAGAARRLFARDGYGATTLKGIAVEAGVAVQTVYAVYGSKAGILAALREDVVRQPEAEAILGEVRSDPSAIGRLDRFARSIRLRWEASADVIAIHRDAATTDPSIRAAVADVLQVRRSGIAVIAASLEGSLRPDLEVPAAAAILDALTMPELYAELVEVHGWTPDAYEAWLRAALRRELLGSDPSA